MLNNELSQKANETVCLLKSKGLTIATAESCTGGLVSSYITTVSGVSEVFEMGVTSYSCRIKHQVLGVKLKTLKEAGAVSEATAREMAENVRKKAKSDLGVSVTGVAGPDSSEGHKPGLVFIGISGPVGTVVKKLSIEPLSRDFVRQTATLKLFELIIEYAGDLKK